MSTATPVGAESTLSIKLARWEPSTEMRAQMRLQPVSLFYRPASSDKDAIDEVFAGAYRRIEFGFDVEPGEQWLDIGSNIGAFAAYVRARGARATCYEPDQACFQILKQNVPHSECFPLAVTAFKEPELRFYKSPNPNNFYRGTVIETVGYLPYATITNCYGGFLRSQQFAGAKLDCEGSEHGLIDEWLLPRVNKLTLEYHCSRDRSVPNFLRRMDILKTHFTDVRYPGSIETNWKLGRAAKDCWPLMDFVVFAWGQK